MSVFFWSCFSLRLWSFKTSFLSLTVSQLVCLCVSAALRGVSLGGNLGQRSASIGGAVVLAAGAAPGGGAERRGRVCSDVILPVMSLPPQTSQKTSQTYWTGPRLVVCCQDSADRGNAQPQPGNLRRNGTDYNQRKRQILYIWHKITSLHIFTIYNPLILSAPFLRSTERPDTLNIDYETEIISFVWAFSCVSISGTFTRNFWRKLFHHRDQVWNEVSEVFLGP